MKPDPESVYAMAIQLSDDDRAGLVDRLLATLEEPIDPAIEAAQIAECEDRLAAYRRGELRSRPGDEIFRRRDAEKSA